MLPGQACSRALVLTFPSTWSHGEKRHTGLSSSCPAMAMVRVQHWGSLGQGAALGGVSGSGSSTGGSRGQGAMLHEQKSLRSCPPLSPPFHRNYSYKHSCLLNSFNQGIQRSNQKHYLKYSFQDILVFEKQEKVGFVCINAAAKGRILF